MLNKEREVKSSKLLKKVKRTRKRTSRGPILIVTIITYRTSLVGSAKISDTACCILRFSFRRAFWPSTSWIVTPLNVLYQLYFDYSAYLCFVNRDSILKIILFKISLPYSAEDSCGSVPSTANSLSFLFLPRFKSTSPGNKTIIKEVSHLPA